MLVSKKMVLEALQESMSSRGFSLDQKSERFIKRTPWGGLYFQLVFTKKAEALCVSPGAYIRFDEVEKLCAGILGLNAQDASNSFTIGIDFWRYYNDESLKFVANDQDDLSHLTASLIWSFDKYARQYFDDFGSLKAADSALNNHPEQVCPHRLLPWLRAVTGLVVAKVVGRANFAELEKTYSHKVNSISGGFYSERFNDLILLLTEK